MKRVLLAAAVAGALIGGPASADTLSFSFSNPLATTEINQTGALGLFDSNLGVLNSVSLTIAGQAVTDLGLTNNAAQSQTARATATVDLFYSSTLAGLDLSAIILGLSMTTGFQSIDSGATAIFPAISDADSTSLTPAASLFSVVGGGTFNIGCTSLSGLLLQGGGGNVDATQATQAACGAEIVYDYTRRPPQLPEPGTLALLGAVALGAGRALRRKAA